VYFSDRLELDTVPLAQGCSAVCVFVNDRLDAPVLEACTHWACAPCCCAAQASTTSTCKPPTRWAVRRPRAGLCAGSRGRTRAGLVMTLNRRTHRAYARVREGNFALDGLLGMTLHGKTVGIVGAGQIGAAAARIFHGMGCKVLVSDPAPTPQLQAWPSAPRWTNCWRSRTSCPCIARCWTPRAT
jgi:D-lactate dehydrogenase